MEEPMTENVENGGVAMDRPALIEAVRKQIEYYFSKENLMNDSFLISQMDANNTVPIAVVMKVYILYNFAYILFLYNNVCNF